MNITKWWHSMTIWFGLLLVALGTAVDYLTTAAPTLAPYFGKWGGAVTVAIGVLNVLLRLRTQTSVKGSPLVKPPAPPVDYLGGQT